MGLDPRIHAAPTSGAMDPRLKAWDDGDWEGRFAKLAVDEADDTSLFLLQRAAACPRPQAAFVTASIGCCERKPTASRFQTLMAPIVTVIFVISSSEKCAFNVS
ncbi:hypothetical protein RHECNPAF_2050010 [Rhizobium etli CNPAF512]|nr:hypothetical protein RHECNPAF_2050010 [Rhizobium etli CNPAF512]